MGESFLQVVVMLGVEFSVAEAGVKSNNLAVVDDMEVGSSTTVGRFVNEVATERGICTDIHLVLTAWGWLPLEHQRHTVTIASIATANTMPMMRPRMK